MKYRFFCWLILIIFSLKLNAQAVVDTQQVTMQVEVYYQQAGDTLWKDVSMLSEKEKCALGTNDAKYLHTRKWMNTALGFTILPLIPIVAIKPKPKNGKLTPKYSDNEALFADSAYCHCYGNEARKKNIFHGLRGASLWMLVAIAVSG